MQVKVRIGVSLGTDTGPGEFAAAVDLLEATGVDSLWLPEHVYGPAVEPFTGIAFALSRTRHLKAGTGISVLPGRHPALVAKQLASLAGLAPRRVLPVFGLQPAAPAERAAFPVPAGPGQRAALFDEALTLLRRLLTADEPVTFEGRFFSVSGACAGPPPAKPLDIWLAGSAPGALRRTGRLADGWLGSLMTPAEAGDAVRVIQAAAAAAGRQVDPDHFGMSIAVAFGPVPDSYALAVARRRPGVAPESLVADGWAGARRLIAGYAEAGLSKFVVRPVGGAMMLAEFIDGFSSELMPLQT
jgi:probable F420-dependent oxidoreductase